MIRSLSDVECVYDLRHGNECNEIFGRLASYGADMMNEQEFRETTFCFEDPATGIRFFVTGERLLWRDANRRIDTLARQEVARKRGHDYRSAAFEVGPKGSPDDFRSYTGVHAPRIVEERVITPPANPGREVLHRMEQLRRKKPGLSVTEAYHEVLEADHTLKFAYAESRNTERR